MHCVFDNIQGFCVKILEAFFKNLTRAPIDLILDFVEWVVESCNIPFTI